MSIKKYFIISCLLSLLTACSNDKKQNESSIKEEKQIEQQTEIVNQPIIEDNTEIIKDEQIKQLNNDYQLFIDEFNAINQQKNIKLN